MFVRWPLAVPFSTLSWLTCLTLTTCINGLFPGLWTLSSPASTQSICWPSRDPLLIATSARHSQVSLLLQSELPYILTTYPSPEGGLTVYSLLSLRPSVRPSVPPSFPPSLCSHVEIFEIHSYLLLHCSAVPNYSIIALISRS